MKKANVGVIGLGVMGYGFVMNLADHGYRVGMANLEHEMIDEVIANHPEADLVPNYSLEEFIDNLEKPRVIFMLIKAGKPTDDTIEKLIPLMDAGDILINGGNTYYKETVAWTEKLAAHDLNYIGLGVSGGEEGARYGAALMPGCTKETYEVVGPILENIAAKAPQDGEPCCTYLGTDGAGHFTKMIHNGIEYGDSEMISEAYYLLRHQAGLHPEAISEIFSQWNDGELKSYLVGIVPNILSQYDEETDQPMIDIIQDIAGSKGTGMWASQTALEIHMPMTIVTEAVYTRYISELKAEREKASEQFAVKDAESHMIEDTVAYIERVRRALYFAKIMSYAQGFAVYAKSNEIFGWDLDCRRIAKIFRAGCVIQAELLDDIAKAYEKNPKLENILFDDYFAEKVMDYQEDARWVVNEAVAAGHPIPCLTAAINYFDTYRNDMLPTNMVQAQRDYFGAHTFERVDKPGHYHHEWFDLKDRH